MRRVERNVQLETIHLAFKLALIRRYRSSNNPLPPIRSLAYFRAVALNLSAEETEPAYVNYIDQLYDHWILGRDAEKRGPRWSVIRDVLGWVD